MVLKLEKKSQLKNSLWFFLVFCALFVFSFSPGMTAQGPAFAHSLVTDSVEGHGRAYRENCVGICDLPFSITPSASGLSLSANDLSKRFVYYKGDTPILESYYEFFNEGRVEDCKEPVYEEYEYDCSYFDGNTSNTIPQTCTGSRLKEYNVYKCSKPGWELLPSSLELKAGKAYYFNLRARLGIKKGESLIDAIPAISLPGAKKYELPYAFWSSNLTGCMNITYSQVNRTVRVEEPVNFTVDFSSMAAGNNTIIIVASETGGDLPCDAGENEGVSIPYEVISASYSGNNYASAELLTYLNTTGSASSFIAALYFSDQAVGDEPFVPQLLSIADLSETGYGENISISGTHLSFNLTKDVSSEFNYFGDFASEFLLDGRVLTPPYQASNNINPDHIGTFADDIAGTVANVKTIPQHVSCTQSSECPECGVRKMYAVCRSYDNTTSGTAGRANITWHVYDNHIKAFLSDNSNVGSLQFTFKWDKVNGDAIYYLDSNKLLQKTDIATIEEAYRTLAHYHFSEYAWDSISSRLGMAFMRGDSADGQSALERYWYDSRKAIIVFVPELYEQVHADDVMRLAIIGLPASGNGSIGNMTYAWLYDPLTVSVSSPMQNLRFDPDLTAQAVAYDPEDGKGILYYDANCSGGDTITYSDNASEFSIDSSTGVISWEPSESDIGSHSFNITCSDGTNSASQDLNVDVLYESGRRS